MSKSQVSPQRSSIAEVCQNQTSAPPSPTKRSAVKPLDIVIPDTSSLKSSIVPDGNSSFVSRSHSKSYSTSTAVPSNAEVETSPLKPKGLFFKG